MEFRLSSFRRTRFTAGALARGLIATALVAAIGWSGALYAANQGDRGFVFRMESRAERAVAVRIGASLRP